MNNAFFTDIIIENFKSLRKVELKDCRRINVLIGKPNVGKSNFLEALSFFSLAHNLGIGGRFNSSLQSYMRYENERMLFFNGDARLPIKIQTNLVSCTVTADSSEDLMIDFKGETYDATIKWVLGERASVPTMKNMSPKKQFFKTLKRYIFENHAQKFVERPMIGSSRALFLQPPYGVNLAQILFRYPDLANDFATVFAEYGLGFFLDKATYTLRIVKKLNQAHEILSGITIPYTAMADTLQRIIFYKTAIASNQDSILLFEEPEAHSFPPYIVDITQGMIYAKNNQFFVTTHSPFVLNDLLENGRDELAVFLMDWKEGETVIKKLTDAQLHDIYQYGIDLFTNLETFL